MVCNIGQWFFKKTFKASVIEANVIWKKSHRATETRMEEKDKTAV
jgi:hypothetical protein